MTPEELVDQKQVEFYASSVDAWYNTSLERDKSILALSAAGVGVLVTLATTVGVQTPIALILCAGALAAFLVAVFVVLEIFHGNRAHIEDIIKGKASGNDPKLDRLDTIAARAFRTGVLLTALVGVVVAIHSYLEREKSVANENVTKVTTPVDMTKSFSGATNLQPAPIAPSAPAAPAPSATVTTVSTPPAPAAQATSDVQSSGK